MIVLRSDNSRNLNSCRLLLGNLKILHSGLCLFIYDVPYRHEKAAQCIPFWKIKGSLRNKEKIFGKQAD